MHIQADTIDDLMNKVLTKLLKLPFDVIPTKGASSEIFGVILQLNNPRARLSRTETKGKSFSALGELLWYLSGSNDLEFITYYIKRYKTYSDDNKTVYGGYGPRLFKMRGKYNQINSIIEILKSKPTSRQAVIQLFDVEDLQEIHKDIPCTCTLQFVIRNGKLNMLTSMRSNDAFLGLPHDIFCFTMLQEIIAKTLNVELGNYKHSIGSLHLYEVNKKVAKQYLQEGIQSTKFQMLNMPDGNPWESIKAVMEFESEIRIDPEKEINTVKMDLYWADICYLLKIQSLFKHKKYETIIEELKKNPSSTFNVFIEKRIEQLSRFAKIDKKEHE